MIYVVTLSYLRPLDDVNAHFDGHREWLVQHIKAGRILLTGPLEPRTGGLLLVSVADRAELDRMMSEDPFVIHRLVEIEVKAFTPALRAAAFPAEWAAGAKPIG